MINLDDLSSDPKVRALQLQQDAIIDYIKQADKSDWQDAKPRGKTTIIVFEDIGCIPSEYNGENYWMYNPNSGLYLKIPKDIFFIATEEEEAEFERMMAEDEQKQLNEESEPDYSGWAKWHYKA